MSEITEQTYSIEELDQLASEIEVMYCDINTVPTELGITVTNIKITQTNTGLRIDYFGRSDDNRKIQFSSWGVSTKIKPSQILNVPRMLANQGGKKLILV